MSKKDIEEAELVSAISVFGPDKRQDGGAIDRGTFRSMVLYARRNASIPQPAGSLGTDSRQQDAAERLSRRAGGEERSLLTAETNDRIF